MNKDSILKLINDNFFSWKSIYNKNPDLFIQYPEILEIIIRKYIREDYIINIDTDTPEIIRTNPRIIEHCLRRGKISILEGLKPDKKLSREIGIAVARAFVYQNSTTSYEIIDYFDNNKELLSNKDVLIGMIEEHPSLFLILDLETIGNYYEELKQVFLDNIDNFIPNRDENYDNLNACKDKDIIKELMDIDTKFTQAIMNQYELHREDKEFLLYLYKKYHLTIRMYDQDCIKQDPDIQIISFENDPKSIKNFINITHPKFVLEILENNIENLLPRISIHSLKHKEVKEYIIKKYNLNSEAQLLLDKIIESLDKGIKISNIKALVKDYSISDYEYLKISQRNLGNLRAYILNLLESSKDYISFLVFEYTNHFRQIFGKEFDNLIIEYYNVDDKREVIKKISDMTHKFTYIYKEIYIKKTYESLINQICNRLYKTNINSETVRKRLKEKLQKKIFIEKYKTLDPIVLGVIADSISKLKARLKVDYPLSDEEINTIVKKYVLNEEQLVEPSRYQDVLKQSEISKVINRLNSGNIDENNIDFIKNKQFIKYKIVNNKKVYYTDYFTFTKEELLECSKYVAYLTVIKLFNGNVMPYIKKIDVDIDYEEIQRLNIDFNDENYLFNQDETLDINYYNLRNILLELNKITELNDNIKDKLLSLLFDQDLLMLIFKAKSLPNMHYRKMIHFQSYYSDDEESVIQKIIRNIERLPLLLNMDDFTIGNYSKIQKYLSILEGLTNEEIELLGPNLINLTIDNTAFNPLSRTPEEKLRRTCNLYKKMLTKTEFTVPRVEGIHEEIRYEVMKQDDPHFLTCGFETDACFRVCGNDNNFLEYCALNKNGFVIKLSDSNGNFLGRASGFRNGNAIYLNQIRTIYDISGDYTKHIPKSFIKSIVDALKACTDHIIEETQNTDEPIDFAIINRAYILEQFPLNLYGVMITREFDDFLKETPVNSQNIDWLEFIQDDGIDYEKGMTKGKADPNDLLTTDYPGYPKVVLSVRNPNIKILTLNDFYVYDPDPIYKSSKKII